MCRTDHVTIYTPFLVIVLICSCHQAPQNTSTISSTIIDSSADNESTDNSSVTVSTTTDSPIILSINLTASAINSSAVKLKWTLSDNTPPLNKFSISWKKDSNYSTFKTKTVNNNTKGVVIGRLEAWTWYEFTINTTLRNVSVNSNAKEQTGPSAPSEPEIYNATSTNTSISVKWKEPNQPNGPLDGYRVELGTVKSKNETRMLSRGNTSASFEGLSPWSNYSITLIAFNKWNDKELKTEVTDTVQTLYGIPSVPRKFESLVNSSRAILLTWEPPENPNGPLDGFVINCWRNNDGVLIKNVSVDGGVTSYLIDKLEPWTTYNFTIDAYNSNLTSEEATAHNKTLAEAPSEPRTFAASVNSSREILLTWEPPEYPNGPLDGFRIIWSRTNDAITDVKSKEVTGNVTSCLIDGLEPWTTYNFTIVAFNSNLTSKEATASNKTLQDAPSVPRNFTATVNSSKSILLSWESPECPNGPLDGFRIKWSESNDATTEVKSTEVTGNVTSCLIDELEPWTTYNFTVAAYNSNLTSEENTLTEKTAPGVPSVPLNFTNTTYEPYEVRLQWEKPVRPRGPLDGYIIIVRTNTDTKEFNTSKTSITVPNLRSWTIYNFILRAYNAWNDGVLTSEEARIGVETKRPEFPGPSLTLNPNSSTTMNVTCEPPELLDHNITGYNITWIKSIECNASHIAIGNYSWRTKNSPEFWIEDLDPATNYSFYIYAFIERDDGEYLTSDVNCTTGRTEDEFPVHPENLTCHDSNSTSITITWEEPTEYKGDIINYTVNYCQLSESENDCKHTEKYSKNDSKCTVKYSKNKYLTISDLEHYTKYQFKVSARTNKGLGMWSKNVECRTRSLVPNSVNDFKISSISSTSMKVTWTPPEPYPGRTNYTLTIYRVFDCDNEFKFITSNVLPAYCNNSLEFKELDAYTKYKVHIQAATESGDSKARSLEERTSPGRPSAVRVTLNKCDPTEITFSWKIPEKPKGEIKSIFIYYVRRKGGERHSYNITKTDFRLDACKEEPPINVTIDQLLPEYSYEFTIYANVDDTNGSFISGESTSFGCRLPAGVPPYPDTNITIVKKSKSQITFELCNDTFSDSMGEITKYAVIVGTANHIGQRKREKINSEKLFTWAEFLNNDSLNYQASPKRWNPFNESFEDSMKCKPVKVGCSQCILGCDNGCGSHNIGDYCNGPLKPGISYGFKIRGYTKGGFAETRRVCASTEPDQAHKPQSGLIVAIVVSLSFLMLLVTGIFIYKKFGIINRFFGKTVMENSIESNEIGFMTVIAKSRPVKLGAFASHVSSMMADSALRFSQEFEELKSISPSHSCSAAQMQENKSKNRWINILPFDHSRVKLLPMDDEPGSDYINSSYIPGFNSLREYIATQGPLPNTIDDMWRMIWEHGISMIVMLTQCVERGKTKCEQYWPSDKEESTYGDLKVQTIHESALTDYTIRSFNVSLGERQRIITQMHFTKWPDFGCPENTELLINFVRTVRDRMVENDPNPMLVHCSAGVGRTGTFIAVNRLAQHIETHDTVDVFHIVLDMRQHRTNMVQTEDQYIYIHECVRDLIQEKLARSNESYKNDEIYGNLGNYTTTNI